MTYHREHLGCIRAAHPAPAVPEKVESPDREEFERQAKYQGITDFSLNQNGFRTYANDIAEFAWRLWANKNSPVYKSMLSAAPKPEN